MFVADVVADVVATLPFHFGAACKLLLYPSSMQQLQPKRHTLVIDSCAFFVCVCLSTFL
jgi:hypothetical protein